MEFILLWEGRLASIFVILQNKQQKTLPSLFPNKKNFVTKKFEILTYLMIDSALTVELFCVGVEDDLVRSGIVNADLKKKKYYFRETFQFFAMCILICEMSFDEMLKNNWKLVDCRLDFDIYNFITVVQKT
jgi:hypothetical protein